MATNESIIKLAKRQDELMKELSAIHEVMKSHFRRQTAQMKNTKGEYKYINGKYVYVEEEVSLAQAIADGSKEDIDRITADAKAGKTVRIM